MTIRFETMPEPIITVILTVFKRIDYLEEAIRSVLKQTFTSIELLVTDDANQPEARAICNKFTLDERVHYRANAQTLGTPLNIAAALRESRGRYIAILNDDDLLEAQALERLVAPLEQMTALVLSFSNYRIVDCQGRELPRETAQDMRVRGRVHLSAGKINKPFDFALRRGLMICFGCLFRREACKSHWLSARCGGAYDFWLALKLASQGDMYFVPETLMSWRQHQNSLSARAAIENYRDNIRVYEEIVNDTTLAEDSRDFARYQLAFLYYLGGHSALSNLTGAVAREMLRNSLRIRWTPNASISYLCSFLPSFHRRLAIKLWHKTVPIRLSRILKSRTNWG